MFTFLLLATPAFGLGMRDVPQVYVADYAPSLRDPFVDPSVSPTILGATGARNLSSVARPLESYVGELEALFLKENKVNGIAIGNDMSLAVVNGKTVKLGARLSVAVPEALSQELLNTSRYYGLGLEAQIGAKLLECEIAEITKTGLKLKLRGTNLRLPYRKNLSTLTD